MKDLPMFPTPRALLGCVLLAISIVGVGSAQAARAEVVGAPQAAQVTLPAVTLPEGAETAVVEQVEALRNLAQAVIEDAQADSGERADAIGELGRHYHAYGMSAAAAECYRLAAGLAPRDFRWPYLLGYLEQAEGRLESAVNFYERALAIVPGVPPTLIRMASAYTELGKVGRAEWLYREAIRANPTSAAGHAGLGELLLAQDRPAEAAQSLETALTLTSAANRLYYPLALAYRKLGDEDKARELLAWRGDVGVRPEDPVIDSLEELKTGERVHLLRGQAAFRVRRFAEAAESFKRAVEINPVSIAGWIDLGSALGQAGDVEGAIAAYERAVELGPGSETALFNLGLLHSRLGEYPRAISLLSQAGQVSPEDGMIRFELARALRLAGRFEDSILHYDVAIRALPELENPRLGKAQALTRLDRVAEARQSLEKALEDLPQSAVLALALSRVLASADAPSVRDPERAVQLALNVFGARKKLEDAEWVAETFAKAGRCEEAVSWQRNVVEQATESAQPETVMARLEESLARYESDRCGNSAGVAPGG